MDVLETQSRHSVQADEWDDTKFRHAYRPSNRKVALCGYAGPSTWKDEWTVPSNACPICMALLPEYLDLANRRWIKR